MTSSLEFTSLTKRCSTESSTPKGCGTSGKLTAQQPSCSPPVTSNACWFISFTSESSPFRMLAISTKYRARPSHQAHHLVFPVWHHTSQATPWLSSNKNMGPSSPPTSPPPPSRNAKGDSSLQ
ncbi:hypothetical protein Pelo_11763 [Pelomyxa schiedti]|nr:hypothetical protein Pelo_11763 [Pelomyxa schiedti]